MGGLVGTADVMNATDMGNGITKKVDTLATMDNHVTNEVDTLATMKWILLPQMKWILLPQQTTQRNINSPETP